MFHPVCACGVLEVSAAAKLGTLVNQTLQICGEHHRVKALLVMN